MFHFLEENHLLVIVFCNVLLLLNKIHSIQLSYLKNAAKYTCVTFICINISMLNNASSGLIQSPVNYYYQQTLLHFCLCYKCINVLTKIVFANTFVSLCSFRHC